MKLQVAELESLFTADVTRFDKAAVEVETKQKQIDGKVATAQIDADGASALQTIDRIASEARSIPDGEVEVTADTSQASRAIDDLGDDVVSSSKEAGDDAGDTMGEGILDGLKTIPIAGAVIAVGAAIGVGLAAAIKDGLQNEVRTDLLMAQTGLDPDTVAVFARASGEAYANAWGDSLEENMDTARQAVQAGLLDPDSTARDAENIIGSLTGVAQVIGEDIAGVTRTTTTLLRTGLAKTADEAFDIIVRGQQEGLNVSEDWLDTLNEYSTKFRDLGLDGPHAIGLMRQAVQAGARDTDKAADALKEFQIRATDGSTASAEAFEILGLNAEQMTAQISRGGEDASAGLGLVLDKLRELEPGAERTTALFGLFGTQSEDLGQALFAMDLDTAAEGLDNIAGSASNALNVMTDNASADIEEAKRNIELASDGIKGALAAAVGPQIEEWANYISGNREAVMQFLLDVANGALEMGIGFAEGTATSAEAIGGFIAGPAADLVETLAGVVGALEVVGLAPEGAADGMRDVADSMRGADDAAADFADMVRTDLIDNALLPAQERLNEFGIPLVQQAAIHDATVAMLTDIDNLGYGADGARLEFDLLEGSLDTTTTAGAEMDEQIRAVVESMKEQATAGAEMGNTQEEITERLNDGREALLNQLEAMGLTREEAEALIETYDAVPEEIATQVELDAATAQGEIDGFITTNTGRRIKVYVDAAGGTSYETEGGVRFEARGGILAPMAEGGITGTPLDPVAQVVPPGTLRVIGDRLDVEESYIPHDGSARSRAILLETMKRMGIEPMADGGITGGANLAAAGDTYVIEEMVLGNDEVSEEIREFFRDLKRRSRQARGTGR